MKILGPIWAGKWLELAINPANELVPHSGGQSVLLYRWMLAGEDLEDIVPEIVVSTTYH